MTDDGAKSKKRKYQFQKECAYFVMEEIRIRLLRVERSRYVVKFLRRLSLKDLVCAVKMMMYGFGDVKDPLDASSELMEDLAVEFITEMVRWLVCVALQSVR
jgi:hypothetical protein